MDGRVLRGRAATVDCRSLMVECPEHKGLLLPVTDIHISYTKESKGEASRLFVIFMEALCVYCDAYKYVRVNEGSWARFSDDEQKLLSAASVLVARCPGILVEEVLDAMTAAGGSRAMVATVLHMGVRSGLAGFRSVEGRLYPNQAIEASLAAVV